MLCSLITVMGVISSIQTHIAEVFLVYLHFAFMNFTNDTVQHIERRLEAQKSKLRLM